MLKTAMMGARCSQFVGLVKGNFDSTKVAGMRALRPRDHP